MKQHIIVHLVRLAMIAILSLVMAAATQGTEEWSTEVLAVIDGDLISVLQDGQAVEIRLEGIDAPEEGQAFFEVSRNGLAHAVLGKSVVVRIAGRDLESRLTGRVYLGETDVNMELVKAGLAWHDRQHSRDEMLMAAEKAARKEKRGLWQQRLRPVPPWKYRLAQLDTLGEREVDETGFGSRPEGG